MTRDDPTDVLIALIRCVPVHGIDLQAAEARGDFAALGYARAMAAWRHQAAQAVAEIRQGSTACARHQAPDAFTRTATVSALMRPQAAE